LALHFTNPSLYIFAQIKASILNCKDLEMAAEETVSVIIDGKAPKVAVSCLSEMEIQQPGVQVKTELEYAVHDNCGGELDVQVKTYANEWEDFNSQGVRW